MAAPAAAAGLLYLNAKWAISYDWRLFVSLMTSKLVTNSREKAGRLNPFYVLEDRAKDKKLADKVFLIFEGRRWTFKQVYETVLKYGTWLKTTFGIKHQEIVAMDFVNSEKFLFMQLGLWSIGARPAFINYNLTGKPLAHCIRVSTAHLVLVDPNVASNVTDEMRAELPGVQFIIFTPQLEVEVMHTTAVREPDSERFAGKMEDMANLIYTSGTTGLPKPAIVSWHKNIAGPVAVATWMGLKKMDVFYTVSAIFVLMGKSNITSACPSITLQPPFLDFCLHLNLGRLSHLVGSSRQRHFGKKFESRKPQSFNTLERHAVTCFRRHLNWGLRERISTRRIKCEWHSAMDCDQISGISSRRGSASTTLPSSTLPLKQPAWD
jgi:hypothetical protein